MKLPRVLALAPVLALASGCSQVETKKEVSSYTCQGPVQLCLVIISKDANGKFVARPDNLTTSKGVGKTIVWAFAEPDEYIFDLVRPKAEKDRIEAVKGKPLQDVGIRPCYPTDNPALGSLPVRQGRYWRCDIRSDAKPFVGLEYQVYFHGKRDRKQYQLDPTMSNNGGPSGGPSALRNEDLTIQPGSGGAFSPSKNPVKIGDGTYVSWKAPTGFSFWDNGSDLSDRLSLSDGSVPICWIAKTANGGAEEQLNSGEFFNCLFVGDEAVPLGYSLTFAATKDSARSTVSGTLAK